MKRLRFAELSLEVPESWIDTSVITLVGVGGDDSHAPNLVITREDRQGDDLKAYAQSNLPEVRRAAKKHKLAKEGAIEIAGRPAYFMEHDVIGPDRVRLKQVQHFFHSGKDVVVVSFTGVKETWARRSKNLAAILESLVVHEE